MTARAALDAGLARIAAEDQHWHAMLALDPTATARAEAIDAATGPRGALHGMTVAIKDNIDLAGMATTSGCRALAQALAPGDATVVARLRAAGAVPIGKTNLSEFSFEIRSRSSLGGDVLCPFDPATTAGGSSGGSAVAVARGYARVALGTDTGGSIRIPAAVCGVVGFRPAHGALPMHGIAPLAPSTDTVGPLAASVADALMVYRAMGGTVAPLADRTSPVRIGVLRKAQGEDPRIMQALDVACARLDRTGVTLVDPFVCDTLPEWLDGAHIVDVEFAAAFDRYLAHHFATGTAPRSLAELVAGGDFLPDHAEALHRRMAADPAQAGAILARHAGLKLALVRAMADARVDGLIYPTLRVVPDSLDNPAGGWAAELAARTGWPAISVPVRSTPDARPIGVELLLPDGEEPRLFALAHKLEAA